MDYMLSNFQTIQENYILNDPSKYLKTSDLSMEEANPYQHLGVMSLKAKERLIKFLEEKKNLLREKNIKKEDFVKVY